MGVRRLVATLAIVITVYGGLPGSVPPAAAQGEACFAETGFCIRDRFLAYWTANGGLARNGFPLSEERRELLEDGREYTVQYFERVRLEYHPENAPPYDVLLGQFGRRVLAGSGVLATQGGPIPGRIYFPETGHNLEGRFIEHWQQNGGLAQFGYPLTEAFEQRLEDGQTYRVQYFERVRLEYHPENPPPYDVLLGQFGRQILAENDALAGDPSFRVLYLTTEMLWFRLGGPITPAARAPGAYQPFERGAMLYRGDTRFIYVLCDDGPWFTAPDTYEEGQPVGGGPGPAPGLYEPRLGFGKLWRENQGVRNCLGYATTPDETAYTLRAQQFNRGQLLSATTPAGRFVYALWVDRTLTRFERFPDPAP